MNSTKKKILDTARELLNHHGLAVVSQRMIADELNISPGNLTYHFKKRSEIIEALYFELVEKMDQAFSMLSQTTNLIEGLYLVTKAMMHNFYDYRFMMLDFIQLMREYTKIKNHYQVLLKQREAQLAQFVEMMIQNKLMRPEEIPNEYTNLIYRQMILGDFWLASAAINSKEMKLAQVDQYLEIVCQAIYPYLTKKAKREYLEIFSIN